MEGDVATGRTCALIIFEASGWILKCFPTAPALSSGNKFPHICIVKVFAEIPDPNRDIGILQLGEIAEYASRNVFRCSGTFIAVPSKRQTHIFQVRAVVNRIVWHMTDERRLPRIIDQWIVNQCDERRPVGIKRIRRQIVLLILCVSVILKNDHLHLSHIGISGKIHFAHRPCIGFRENDLINDCALGITDHIAHTFFIDQLI